MEKNKPSPLPSILVAEDEETEIMLLELALKKAGLNFPVVFMRDGQETIDYLSSLSGGGNGDAEGLPSLIVLDLKMPRLTGFDVLGWLSTQPQLQHIPAVVLSSSSYPEDIRKATELGAQEFLIKPHTLNELVNLLRTAVKRWLARPNEPSVS